MEEFKCKFEHLKNEFSILSKYSNDGYINFETILVFLDKKIDRIFDRNTADILLQSVSSFYDHITIETFSQKYIECLSKLKEEIKEYDMKLKHMKKKELDLKIKKEGIKAELEVPKLIVKPLLIETSVNSQLKYSIKISLENQNFFEQTSFKEGHPLEWRSSFEFSIDDLRSCFNLGIWATRDLNEEPFCIDSKNFSFDQFHDQMEHVVEENFGENYSIKVSIQILFNLVMNC